MPKYLITIECKRTEYAQTEVEADNQHDAEELAQDRMYDLKWKDVPFGSHKYQITHTTKIND